MALAAAGCLGDTAGPHPYRPAAFALAPRFSMQGSGLVAFDKVRVTLSRSGSVALDTTVAFPSTADSIRLALTAPITGTSESLTLTMEMINAAGDTVFRGGPLSVTLTTGNLQAAPLPVSVRYTGVGANAKSVRIGTRAISLFFGDSVVLAATAYDSSGQPIPGTPIAWQSLDTLLARVPAESIGKVIARTTRGVAGVQAMLLTNLADTAQVTVEPAPSAITLVSGGGQTGAVGSVLPLPVTVLVKAADNLPVQGVAVAFAVAAGGGSVAKATDTTNATGNAATAWTLGGTLGAQSLTATVVGSPTLTVSAAATGIAGPPKKLAFLVQPSSVAANVAMVPAVQVVAQDSFGNTATAFTGSVTVAIGTNPGGSTLGGTATVAAVAGVATFTNLTLNLAGTGYTLLAGASGLQSATSAAFNVTGGVPTQLAFVQQPSNATSGAAITPAVTVQIRDANGNAVTSATNAVTIAIGTNPGGGTLSGTKTVSAVGGLATFSGLSIDKAGTGYTLAAGATGLTGATSAAFTVAAGSASQLAFTTEPPASTTAGAGFGVVLTARDSAGNTATAFTGNVTVAITSGTGKAGAALRGTTTVAAVAGVATFSGLSIDSVSTGYTLTATATGLTAAVSSAITVASAAASRLAFTVEPANTTAGTGFGVAVTARDSLGNTATSFTGNVTVAITSGTGKAGAALRGTTTVAAVAGIATFSGLSIDSAGTGYTLTASATGLGSAASTAFAVAPAPATRLAFTTEPPVNVIAGTGFGTVVTARDSLGNAATAFTGTVTVAITSGTGKTGATLRGTTTLAAVAGVATFSGLSIDSVANGYTLTATATGLASATSTTLNVLAASASRLVFTTEPPASVTAGAAFGVVVTARDSLGNTATGFTGSVTVAITSGTGKAGAALRGTTTVTAAAGVATFSGLSIDSVGTGYTLTANATGVASATSTSMNVTAGTAASLAFTIEPPPSSVALAPFGFTVSAKDAVGNVATTFTGPVTVAIGTNPAGGTLSGTLTVSAVAGVATFSGISIDNVGNGYTLVASASGLASGTSAAFNIVAPAGVNAWINPAGGNWSVATNWSKGTVPVATDTVTITQSGTYTVNLDVNGTFAKITAGAPSGTQTLSVAANTLSAGTGNGTFAANTVLDLSGTGTITGAGTLTLSGPFNWTGGSLGGTSGAGGTIRVLSGVATTIAPSANVSLQGYTLELDGPTAWTGTALVNSGSGGTLRVGAGGVLTVSGDPTISYSLGGAAPLFTNLGTVNRTTSGNAFVVNAPVSGTGAWNVQTGSLNLQSGGTVSGPVAVSSGATLNLLTTAAALTFDATSSLSGAGAVNFGGGTTTIAGTYGVTGTTFITGGTANFNAASSNAGPLNLSAGNLSGTGLLTVNGPMNWTGGNLGAASGAGGTTHVAASTSLAINPTAGVSFQGYTLEVAGAGSWSGTQTVSSGSGAILRVASGGALDIRGNPTFSFNLGGAAPALNVAGTVTRDAGGGIATIGVPFNDTGTVTITLGTLQLTGGGTSTGAFSVAAGDTLAFGGGTHTLAAASSITGAGTVVFSAGTATVAGTYNVTGTTAVTGGTANFNGTGAAATAVSLAGGTLGGTGVLSISGNFAWTGGTLGNSGLTTKVLANATWTMAPAAAVTFVSDTLLLSGTGTWTGNQTVNAGSGATLRVMTGGVLNIQGNPTLAYTQGGALPLLDNQGTINRAGGASAATIGVPFNQVGALNVDSGVVVLASGGTMSGPVTEAPATVLQLSGGTFSLANKFVVTGPSGFTQLVGGTLGGLTATDTAFFDNLQIQGGTVSLSGGTITTPFELLWTGAAAVSGGTLFIPGTAGLSMSFTTGSPSLQNATILLASGSGGGWTATTPLNAGSGAVIRVLSGANLSLSGAGGGFLYNLGGTAPLLDNQGTVIAAPSSGSPGAFTVSAPISNTGSLQVTLDTLRLSGGFTGTFPGAISVATGATLELGGGSYTLASALTVGGNLLVSGGTLATAGHPVAVTQNFGTSGTGVLQMTSAADSLGVGGNASFGGGSTTGQLTAGIIDLKGNFAQSGNVSSFAPSTAQRTRFSGAALQTVSFASPTQSFFDTLIVDHGFSGGSVELLTNATVNRGVTVQNLTTLNGPTARLRVIGGTLAAPQSTSSPTVNPLVIELSNPPSIGGAPVFVSPDTMVYNGAITSLPVSSGLVYRSLRVNTTGALSSPGGVTYNGDLIVSSGSYAMGANIDSVGGFLRTEGTGSLVMQAIVAAPTLAVRDSAVFAGGASNNLSGGLLRVNGNFVQRGSGGQFAPTATAVQLQRPAAGTQTIQMADSVGSFFHDLTFVGNVADTIRLLSNVQVQDSAVMSGTSVLVSNAFEALKVLAAGTLRVHSQAVLTPFRAEAGTWTLDSTFLGGNFPRISPDTAVILNGSNFSMGGSFGISSSPSPVMAWKSVRLAGGSLTSFSTNYSGALVISGGTYGYCSGTDSVAGFLRTEGSGVLSLSCAEGETMVVGDSAVFAGGTSIMDGTLRLYGNFVQRGSATAYQGSATGAFFGITDFHGSGAQTVSFANPDSGTATGSQFGNLLITNTSAAGVTFATKVFALGQLQTADTIQARVVHGSSNDLSVHGLHAWMLTFDNVPLVVDSGQGGITSFANNTWTNMNGAATQLWFREPGGANAIYGFANLTFSQTLTTGLYVHLTDVGTATPGVTLDLTGTTPASSLVNFATQTLLDGAVLPVLSWLP